MNSKSAKKGLLPYVFLFCFILICLFLLNNFNTVTNDLTYDEFIDELNNNEITELNIIPKTRSQTYEITGKLKDYKETEIFELTLPMSDEFMKSITEASKLQDFT